MGTHNNESTGVIDQVRHGKVSTPKSRAQFLFDEGRLNDGQLNEIEGGKFFPQIQGGLSDAKAKDDVFNRTPPADGLIASAGHTADERNLLNAPGSHWKKHAVVAGQDLTVTWNFNARHKTRRFNYFLTQTGWNHNEALARHHFEAVPVYSQENSYQPYWGADAEAELKPEDPTLHQIPLPVRLGYHVLLAVWEVADTPAAFYQVIDLQFTDSQK